MAETAGNGVVGGDRQGRNRRGLAAFFEPLLKCNCKVFDRCGGCLCFNLCSRKSRSRNTTGRRSKEGSSLPLDTTPTHHNQNDVPFPLLPEQKEPDKEKHCMILDLDETLVHSTFQPVENPDYVLPVEVNGVEHQVYVLKRPHVDEFLEKIGQLYECVLFTASLKHYADQVANLLDKSSDVFKARLFRDSCLFQNGYYIKDLSKLGRDLERVVILDNCPASYLMHPENAIPVQSWFDDKDDHQLLQMMPFLERLATVENIYTVLRNTHHPFNDTTKRVSLNQFFYIR